MKQKLSCVWRHSSNQTPQVLRDKSSTNAVKRTFPFYSKVFVFIVTKHFNICTTDVSSNPEVAEMVSYDSLKRTFKYWRQADRPQLPKCLNEMSDILNMPAWQQLLTFDVIHNGKQETHVLDVHHLNVDDGTIVIFVDRQFALKFEIATDFFVDATFDTVPNVKGAYQLLTIMAERFGKVSCFAQ